MEGSGKPKNEGSGGGEKSLDGEVKKGSGGEDSSLKQVYNAQKYFYADKIRS